RRIGAGDGWPQRLGFSGRSRSRRSRAPNARDIVLDSLDPGIRLRSDVSQLSVDLGFKRGDSCGLRLDGRVRAVCEIGAKNYDRHQNPENDSFDSAGHLSPPWSSLVRYRGTGTVSRGGGSDSHAMPSRSESSRLGSLGSARSTAWASAWLRKSATL